MGLRCQDAVGGLILAPFPRPAAGPRIPTKEAYPGMPETNTNTAPLAVELPPSNPQSKPAPTDRAQYGLEELYQFRAWRRSEFVEAHGQQPPAFNPEFEVGRSLGQATGIRIKRWYDTSVAGLPPQTPVAYQTATVGRDGKPQIITLQMTAAEAMTLNLPGQVSYPKYESWDGLRPTKSAFVWTAGIQIRNNMVPAWLLEPDLARSLAAEIARDTRRTAEVKEMQPSGATQHDYDLADPRRLLVVAVSGLGEINAGQLFAQRSRAAGIGSPGKWSIVKEPVNGVTVDKLVWTPTAVPMGEMETSPECPVPIRPLAPGESLAVSMFGGVVVQRPAEMGGGQAPAATGGGGGLTPEQDMLLRMAQADVAKLLGIVMSSMPGQADQAG